MVHAIGEFELDEDRFELRVQGSRVRVEPRVLDLILYLFQRRSRVVSKDELLANVWRENCVVDSALTRCVSLARKALGNPSAIRTIYGRGYCWGVNEAFDR